MYRQSKELFQFESQKDELVCLKHRESISRGSEIMRGPYTMFQKGLVLNVFWSQSYCKEVRSCI